MPSKIFDVQLRSEKGNTLADYTCLVMTDVYLKPRTTEKLKLLLYRAEISSVCAVNMKALAKRKLSFDSIDGISRLVKYIVGVKP